MSDSFLDLAEAVVGVAQIAETIAFALTVAESPGQMARVLGVVVDGPAVLPREP